MITNNIVSLVSVLIQNIFGEIAHVQIKIPKQEDKYIFEVLTRVNWCTIINSHIQMHQYWE